MERLHRGGRAAVGVAAATQQLGPPLYAIVTVLKPAIALLNWVANVVLRLLRVEPQEEVASAFTADEVAAFITESRRSPEIERRTRRRW